MIKLGWDSQVANGIVYCSTDVRTEIKCQRQEDVQIMILNNYRLRGQI